VSDRTKQENGENNVSIAYDFQNFRNLPSPPPNITYLYPNSSFILDNDVDIFTLMSLRFELSINNNETSFTEFKNRFSLGNMAFANQPYAVGTGVGVEVIWYEIDAALPNGYTRWNSAYGTASQTGSIFKIVEILPYEVLGQEGVLVKAEFTCKLYNQNNNAVKTLTSGQVVTSFAFD
jgi:hypothetical protein